MPRNAANGPRRTATAVPPSPTAPSARGRAAPGRTLPRRVARGRGDGFAEDRGPVLEVREPPVLGAAGDSSTTPPAGVSARAIATAAARSPAGWVRTRA